MTSSAILSKVILAIIILTIFVTTVDREGINKNTNANAFIDPTADERNAPVVTSDGNVYVAWWTNKTGNNEVIFRSSNDNGLTFGDKINLSNSTDTESVDVEISADGENVYVTWWERNQTVNEPVLRISNDAGATFGPIVMLGTNGTFSITEEGTQTQ